MSAWDDRGPAQPELLLAVAHVTDEELRISADPETVRVWYGYQHHRMPPHEPNLPHEVVIRVQGLRHGETLEIHLASIHAHVDPAQADELLRSIFPTAAPAAHGFGWEVPFGTTSLRTGDAWSRFGNVANVRIKYDLVVYRGGRELARFDPDVHLEPDP